MRILSMNPSFQVIKRTYPATQAAPQLHQSPTSRWDRLHLSALIPVSLPAAAAFIPAAAAFIKNLFTRPHQPALLAGNLPANLPATGQSLGKIPQAAPSLPVAASPKLAPPALPSAQVSAPLLSQSVSLPLLQSQPPQAKPVAKKNEANGPFPRYDKMMADGLLDVTLAIGYDEPQGHYSGANLTEEWKLDQALRLRGFVPDRARAEAILQQAGRSAESGSHIALYVKQGIATAHGQPVHSVVRVIKSGDSLQGGQVTRQAVLQGMNQSDVFLYGGHGRYGSGPDFDRNFTVTIDWSGVPDAPAQGKVTYQGYLELKKILSPQDNDAEAIARIKALQKENRVEIVGSNDGNILLNKSPKHTHELGGYLMYEAIKNEPLPLKAALTEDNYRLWLINGCRTQDYVQSVRQQGKSNKHLNSQNLDLFVSRRMLFWNNTSSSLLTFLDGIMAQEDTVGLIDRLRVTNPGEPGRSHSRQGFDDNPYRNPLQPD